jgi:hypothetical protein
VSRDEDGRTNSKWLRKSAISIHVDARENKNIPVYQYKYREEITRNERRSDSGDVPSKQMAKNLQCSRLNKTRAHFLDVELRGTLSFERQWRIVSAGKL